MASQHYRQLAATAAHPLDDALEAAQRLTVELMSVVDKEHDRFFMVQDKLDQGPFAFLGLGWRLTVFLSRQIIKQCQLQRAEVHPIYIHSKRFGDRKAAFFFEPVLKLPQQRGFTAADHAGERDQAALADGGLQLLQPLLVVVGLKIATLAQAASEPKMVHDLWELDLEVYWG